MPQNGVKVYPRVSSYKNPKQTDTVGDDVESSELCTSCTVKDVKTTSSYPSMNILFDFLTSTDFMLFIVFLIVGLLMLTLKILYEVRSELDLMLHLKWGKRALVRYA